MKPKRRWLAWVLEESARNAPSLPWKRRARKARQPASARA